MTELSIPVSGWSRVGQPGVSTAVRRLASLLLLVCSFLLAHVGASFAAQISGTITDHLTGAPIREAQLTVDLVRAGQGEAAGLAVGEPVARPETDAAGNYEAHVQPGTYWIRVEAPGYFDQGLGAPTGNDGSPDLQVGEAGLLGLNAQMVPNTSPFLGLFPTVMRWTHESKGGFRSMVLFMEYGGFAAIPSGWPDQHLITHITDSKGRAIWASALTNDDLVPPGGEGEGGPRSTTGSADGCEFFGSSKEKPNVEHLHVFSYLEANPTYRVEEAITPDRSECSKTKLSVRRPGVPNSHQLLLMATIEDRLPEDQKVPGIMSFAVDGHRPVYIRVANAVEPTYKTKKVRTHPGVNEMVVSFKPSVTTVTPPQAKTLRFKIARGHHRRRLHLP